MKQKWKDTSLLHKVVTIASIGISVSVVVLAVLQLLDVWDLAANVYVPLMGALMLCQAYTQWRSSRTVAYFSIGAAVFIFACAAVVFL